jgi:hypothetical protein
MTPDGFHPVPGIYALWAKDDTAIIIVRWNCMFSFHLKLHYGQAEYVVQATKIDQGSEGNVW